MITRPLKRVVDTQLKNGYLEYRINWTLRWVRAEDCNYLDKVKAYEAHHRRAAVRARLSKRTFRLLI